MRFVWWATKKKEKRHIAVYFVAGLVIDQHGFHNIYYSLLNDPHYRCIERK